MSLSSATCDHLGSLSLSFLIRARGPQQRGKDEEGLALSERSGCRSHAPPAQHTSSKWGAWGTAGRLTDSAVPKPPLHVLCFGWRTSSCYCKVFPDKNMMQDSRENALLTLHPGLTAQHDAPPCLLL